jgi:hypothetical protein
MRYLSTRLHLEISPVIDDNNGIITDDKNQNIRVGEGGRSYYRGLCWAMSPSDKPRAIKLNQLSYAPGGSRAILWSETNIEFRVYATCSQLILYAYICVYCINSSSCTVLSPVQCNRVSMTFSHGSSKEIFFFRDSKLSFRRYSLPTFEFCSFEILEKTRLVEYKQWYLTGVGLNGFQEYVMYNAQVFLSFVTFLY